ncbi:hypothetical protein LCGC14_1975900 [marine sediment metagenome]|uniref:HTH cro/C1-type domain-containing protein n=1 Tax=marine sediment metagenome TaxID=412755 RepID=A0A0F9HNS3_9ZZZZ
METASKIINKLIEEHNYSKWRISKLVGVSWQTVHSWHRDFFQPNTKHLEDLMKLFNNTE